MIIHSNVFHFQVIFDSDPAPIGHSVPTQIEMMSQAMIRGVMDESGEQFVAYFLPTEETMEKRAKDFTEGKEYDDEQVRPSWNHDFKPM
jgi:RNA polymerase II-associated factor 1